MKLREFDIVTIVRYTPMNLKEIVTYLCVTYLTYERLIKKNQYTNYLVIGSVEHQMLSSLQMYGTFERGLFKSKSNSYIAFDKTQLIEVIANRDFLKSVKNKLRNSLWYISTQIKKVYLTRIKSGK
jgi:hypothetical protein